MGLISIREDEIIRTIQTFSTPALNWFFFGITQLGSWIFFIILVVALFINGKRKHAILLASILLFGSYFIVNPLKLLIGRPRPTLQIFDHVSTTNPSMPSGHAFSSFAVATYAILHNLSLRKKSAYYTYAVLVSISRVYFGVHWPSDVVVGAILGIFTSIAVHTNYLRCWEFFNKLSQRKKVIIVMLIGVGLGISICLTYVGSQ
ncbi:MAG: phosphatase PAP2 family protein [Candidatus Heimdallarchaeota archaeon]